MDSLLRTAANVAFRFVVLVDNIPNGAFTECAVPVVEWEIEEVKEGGLNTYTHQLPGRRKGTKVTLKNGVGSLPLLLWYLDCMSEKFSRRSITLNLLGPLLIPVMVWHIENAYPVKWTGPQLKSSDNTIAIQTLEFACGEISVIPGMSFGF
jgi:phage tail-like protein